MKNPATRRPLLGSWVVLALVLLAGGSLSHGSQDDAQDTDLPNLTLSGEKKLIKKLLDEYEKAGVIGRPVLNTSDTVRVDFGLNLIQVMQLNEVTQVLQVNVWNMLKWRDNLLTWDPTEHDNVKRIQIPSQMIWNPRIVLYNFADERQEFLRKAFAQVDYTGDVVWTPQSIYKSTCFIDVTYFPFDIQTCKLKFGSWVYDGFKVDINFYDGKEEVDLTEYISSNTWELIDYPAKRNVKRYSCCPEPYPDITFMLKLRRKSAFFTIILVVPCVLLSLLTLVIYWMPPNSPAKTMLGITIFVVFFVLLLLLAKNCPKGITPVIGKYFAINMIMITLSTFLSTLVAHTYMRGERRNLVPKWLRIMLLDGVAKVLCMTQELGLDEKSRMEELAEQRGKDEEYDRACMRQARLDKQSKKRRSRKGQDFGLGGYIRSIAQTVDGDMVTSSTALGLSSCVTPPLQPTSKMVAAKKKFPVDDYIKDSKKASKLYVSNPGERVRIMEQYQLELEECLEDEIRQIRKFVMKLIGRVERKRRRINDVADWKKCAVVLDRIFFMAYLATIFASLSAVFPQLVCYGPCWK